MDNILNIAQTQSIYGNELLKLAVSVLLGCIIGFEREIRGKSAGLRTLALICFGATIFTICSYLLGIEANRDRIAANIITGVGFIGAGVIFRNNATVSGITTAASIWIAAAIGMLVGIGDFMLATISVVFSLIILYALDSLQFWIDDQFQHRYYKVLFKTDQPANSLPDHLQSLKLNIVKLKISRVELQTRIEFEVSGKDRSLSLLNQWLMENEAILSFEW